MSKNGRKVAGMICLCIFLGLGVSSFFLSNEYHQNPHEPNEVSTPPQELRIQRKLPYGWSTIGDSVFYEGYQRLGIDSESLIVLNEQYAKDQSNVFFSGIFFVPDPLVDSFEVIESNFAKDKQRIYFQGYPLESADIDSFKVLSSCVAKDKNAVYLDGYRVLGEDENIDIPTFQPSHTSAKGRIYFRDKNHTYLMWAGCSIAKAYNNKDFD